MRYINIGGKLIRDDGKKLEIRCTSYWLEVSTDKDLKLMLDVPQKNTEITIENLMRG